jgi:ABC-type ATPase with predicted acetyltransferase domain
MVRARNRHFGVTGYAEALRFANANLRTISRVIVHPQFRAAGIAQALVRQLLDVCPTRYVECSASMAAFAGFLTRCGFRRLPTGPAETPYFLFDRFISPNQGETP